MEASVKTFSSVHAADETSETWNHAVKSATVADFAFYIVGLSVCITM